MKRKEVFNFIHHEASDKNNREEANSNHYSFLRICWTKFQSNEENVN